MRRRTLGRGAAQQLVQGRDRLAGSAFGRTSGRVRRPGAGLFACAAGREQLTTWATALASASRNGTYDGALEATSPPHHPPTSPTPPRLERHSFLERFGDAAARMMQERGAGRQDPSAPAVCSAASARSRWKRPTPASAADPQLGEVVHRLRAHLRVPVRVRRVAAQRRQRVVS